MLKPSLLLLTLFFVCSFASAQVIVKMKPGKPPTAVKPPCPHPGYIWIDGEWHYSRRFMRYVWVGGHWTKPAPGFTWVAGHWLQGSWGYKWMPGHWEKKGNKKK